MHFHTLQARTRYHYYYIVDNGFSMQFHISCTYRIRFSNGIASLFTGKKFLAKGYLLSWFRCPYHRLMCLCMYVYCTLFVCVCVHCAPSFGAIRVLSFPQRFVCDGCSLQATNIISVNIYHFIFNSMKIYKRTHESSHHISNYGVRLETLLTQGVLMSTI